MNSLSVLLLNGSPHEHGATDRALRELGSALNANGIDTVPFWIGNKAIHGCIGCFECRERGICIFQDERYLALLEKIQQCDGIAIGSPVYYAGPNGTLCALLDRIFFSGGRYLSGKCATALVNCRRGGASAAFDRLNKYFTINLMPVVSSQYWNSTHGWSAEEVEKDLEGLQTMRTLGANMAYLMKSIAASGLPKVKREEWIMTNFIR